MNKLAFICLASGALMLAPAFTFAQGNIVELGAGLSGLPSDEFIAWSAASLPDADPGNGFLFDDIEATLPSGTFMFDLAITSSSATPLALRNGIFIGSDGNVALSDGEVLTLTVSDVTNDFVFDGFTNIGSADSGPNEGFIFGNQTFLRDVDTNGDDDPRNGIVLDAPTIILPGPSTTFESVGTVALRGVLLQFTNSVAPVLPGDFDLDGDVDVDDLDQYNGNIGEAAQGGLEALDLNDDGTVGADDFAQHYSDLVETSNGQTGTFAGDANLDGIVDVLGDAAILIDNLNMAATSWGQGDFNGDGTVDVLGDAAALVDNLGATNNPAAGPATSAVPEPGSLSLLALAGIAATIGRRR